MQDLLYIYADSGNPVQFFYVVTVINGVRYSFTGWDGPTRTYQFVVWKNIFSYRKNPHEISSSTTWLSWRFLIYRFSGSG